MPITLHMSDEQPSAPKRNNTGAFGMGAPKSVPLFKQSSEVGTTGMRKDDIRAAFRIFDKDGASAQSSDDERAHGRVC